MKTKIRSYSDVAIDFDLKEMLKAGSNCTCLGVIVTDSALKKKKTIICNWFFKKCKYIEKEAIRHIIRDPEISSDESEEE